MNCPFCGNEILPNTSFCVDCGKKLPDGALELAEKEKKEKIKNVMSDHTDFWKIILCCVIFPGLSHIALFKKRLAGAAIMFFFILSLFAADRFTGTYFIDIPFLFMAYLTYILTPLDAFRIYRQKYNIINDKLYKQSVYMAGYFLMIFASLVFFTAYTYYQSVYRVISINTDIYKPLLDAGYRILAKSTEDKEQYKRGELIVFQPANYYFHGMNIRGEYIEKIVGMPGETIIIKPGELLINGKPLDKKFWPLGSNASIGAQYAGKYMTHKNQYLVFLNGILNGRAASIPMQIENSSITGKVDSIVYPFGKRKKIIDATDIYETETPK